MTTRYDRMRAAADALDRLTVPRHYTGTHNALGEMLRADADELERVEQDARNLAFHHDDAAFDGLADRIRGDK